MNKLFLITLAGLVGCASCPEQTAKPAREASPSCRVSKLPFKLGCARFTMHRHDFKHTLEILQDTDVHYLGLIDKSIPREASDAEIADYKALCAKYGVQVVSAGPLYYDNEETLRKCCEFAKRYGMSYISVVPFEKKIIDGKEQRVESEAMLDLLEKYCRKYDLKAAIHNHGPDIPYLYPTAEAVWKRIEKRDARIGFCLDVGHQRRAGNDPAAAIRKYAKRLYEVHLKNIKIDPVKNYAKEGPRGELDIHGILQTLVDIGFDGYCLVEYEKDFDVNEVPFAESIGYYRGVMDCLKTKVVLEPVPANANTLTAAEKAAGWELLWDGKNVPEKWVGDAQWGFNRFPERGWRWANGELWMLPKNGIADGKWFPLAPEDAKLGGGGSIQTRKSYRDFHFKVDFKLTEAANSGIKYFFNEKLNRGSCEEYQLLDKGHPDYNVAGGLHRVGALYDLLPAPKAEDVLRPLGKWNTAEVISKGAHVEHWLNGVKILEYERGSAAFRAAVAKSKYAKWGADAAGKPQPWGELPAGRIHLQDHSDSKVYFCNIKIKEL